MLQRILIIDDDTDDFELLSDVISEIDPSISVEHIKSCDDVRAHRKTHFDLILLDINMPLHDGFFWLKGIREKEKEKLPIIMYTNSSSPAHISKAYTEGANLFFPKPDSFSILKKSVQKLLELDWSHPSEITKEYSTDGNYKLFKFS